MRWRFDPCFYRLIQGPFMIIIAAANNEIIAICRLERLRSRTPNLFHDLHPKYTRARNVFWNILSSEEEGECRTLSNKGWRCNS